MVFQIEICTFQHLCVDLEKVKLVHNFKLYLVNRKFEQYIMVNNSTNINNHLSPQIIERKKRTTPYDIGNPGFFILFKGVPYTTGRELFKIS